ncbi:MAG: SDR family oxidoreductase [Chitinophagaceae bacterium]|nr:MAG: SDR family oxidoreductase [Chitinophagaceae bacterium]
MNLHNKTALVTGAASGIGRGIALALARRGCHLALADIDAGGLAETGGQVAQYPVRRSLHQLDVCDRAAIAALPAEVLRHHGQIDIIVNNAGIAAGGTFLQVDEKVFDRVLEVNFHAPVRITRCFLPLLLQRPEARIVNISSIYGLISPIEQTAYSSSKFALRGFSNALRHELEGGPVGVTVVHPGGVATNIARNAVLPPGASEADVRQRQALMEKLLRLPPEKAGELIARGIERNRARILVGSDARALALLERIAPVHYWKLLRRIAGRALLKSKTNS